MEDQDGVFEEIARRIRGGDEQLRGAVTEELLKLTIQREPADLLPRPSTGWYVIRVELTSGRADELEPPPGRDFLVSPQHTFRQLAEAINGAFARWDLGHLYGFKLADGTMVGTAFEDLPFRDAARTKIGRRDEGEVFGYEFDLGDSWMHRCTILEAGVHPEDVYGARPKGPVAVWGWGSIPDQYGRTTPEE